MRRALVVAMALSLAAPAATFAWSAEAPTPSDGATGDEVSVAVQQQAQIQQAKLVEHHAKVVDLRERVEQAALDHQARQASQLGDRAPKETIPPMATIAPIENGGDD